MLERFSRKINAFSFRLIIKVADFGFATSEKEKPEIIKYLQKQLDIETSYKTASETNNLSGSQDLMKTKIILVLLLLTFPALAITKKSEYIGYKHKGVKYGETLPNGVKDLGGGLLSNENYGVSRFTKGKKYMLWMEKISDRDTKGVPNWEVKDVLDFDNLKKNQSFMFSYSSGCLQNGKENLDMIVMTEFLPTTKTYKILKAWKSNLKKEKFEKLSTKGIKCEYAAP